MEFKREIYCKPWRVLSMGKATPFEGMEMYGRNVLTVCGGKIVYKKMEE